MPLTADRQREATHRIAQWRANPGMPVACPICEQAGLAIIDRSARPHAEWYALSCGACGLSETLHVSLGATIQPVD
jgi:transcription elongation factor Elf1